MDFIYTNRSIKLNLKAKELIFMDKIIKFEINSDADNKEVKYILKNRIGLSDGIITDLKKTDAGIMLDGRPVYVNERVKEGQELIVSIFDERSDIPGSDVPLEILYEDEDIIALNKPRKIPTHPSLNHYDDTLANGLMQYYSGKNFTFRAITRLDKDTSGVVLVAKNPFSATVLSRSMKNAEINKQYVAIVNGVPTVASGVVNAPIKRERDSIILRCVSPDGKEAITEYETVVSCNGLSLVKLIPRTGRTHQLRVHLSHIGTPIYGDDLYGAPQRSEATRLHCRKISFKHPTSGETIDIEAPLPDDIIKLIDYKE
jgi:23S rRNA pseudouridine1911/1915/1917 synthase